MNFDIIIDELEKEVERLKYKASCIKRAIKSLRSCNDIGFPATAEIKEPKFNIVSEFEDIKSELAFQEYFNSEEKCRSFLEDQRWGSAPACPHCASTNVKRFATNPQIFKCREKSCRQKFSVLTGTIYENSKLPLTKWLLATYILSEQNKAISSIQLANRISVTQKSAWHLKRKIGQVFRN